MGLKKRVEGNEDAAGCRGSEYGDNRRNALLEIDRDAIIAFEVGSAQSSRALLNPLP
jgi:hypothetical protein